MSLIAWYPLKDDIKDYSRNFNDLNNSSPATIVQDLTNGKLGKSYSFNGTGYLSSKNKVSYTKVTLAAWVFRTDTTIVSGIVGNFSHKGAAGYNLALMTSTNRIMVAVPDKDSTGASVYSSVSSPAIAPLNTWCHIAVTVDTITGIINYYLNGNFIETKTIEASNLPITIVDKELLIGQQGWDYLVSEKFVGKINDVRVYDHILTRKEVRDIYKTCILHYNFNDPYAEPTQNYIPNGDFSGSLIKPYEICYHGTIEIVQGAGMYGSNALKHTATTNDSFTNNYYGQLSVMAPTVQGDIWTESVWVRAENDNVQVALYMVALDSGYLNISADTKNKIFTIGKEWTKLVLTHTIPTTNVKYIGVRLDNDIAGNVVYWSNWQLEKKDHETPFVNGIRDGIVSDNSGYGNDGIIALDTSPKFIEAGKVGKGCFEFGIGKFINTNLIFNTTLMASLYSQFTLSAWVKIIATPTARCTLVGGTYYSGFGILVNELNQIMSYYRTSSSNEYNITFDASLDTWYHITLVLDKVNLKLRMYINGSLGNEMSVVDEPFQYESTFAINKLQSSGGNTFDTCKCVIDDVRLYATAFTAADILSLYKTKYLLNANGDLSCNQIIEADGLPVDNKFEFTKDGVLKCTEIDELGIYGMDFKVLDDGSMWAKIFHHYNRGGTVLFASDAESLNSQTVDKYSKLYLLEKFKATDGKFEFMLEYPNELAGQYNRWKQTSNPTVATTPDSGVTGYQAINISWTASGWGGLEYNGGSTLCDGTVNSINTYYGIGYRVPWNGAIPGPDIPVSYTELWVRLDTVTLETNKMKITKDNILSGGVFSEF